MHVEDPSSTLSATLRPEPHAPLLRKGHGAAFVWQAGDFGFRVHVAPGNTVV